MKKIINTIFIFFTVYTHAGVAIYSSDTTVLGLEINEKSNLTTSTLLGGGNDAGGASIADCSVKYKLKEQNKNYEGNLIPFSTDLMGYESDSKNIALFEVDKKIITFTTNESIDVCPLGTDFTGDYSLVNSKSREYKADFDSLIKLNHTNALHLFKTDGALEASISLEPYIKESISNNLYYEEIFNDYGFLLQQAGLNKDAINILSLVIKKSPKRAVAYLNIADASWGEADKKAAAQFYKLYIYLVSENNHTYKIPQRAIDRSL
ncbi:tetratricopeptide repeat protein [Serratia sp. NPDC078593]|uniref:tetratricopeptide repeat protein n=1 Tax=unclassified Serratia (in: enterobacteria) TaxID=2647522 RepID=UPI0037D94ECC